MITFVLFLASLTSCVFSTNYFSSAATTLKDSVGLTMNVSISDSNDLVTLTLVGPSTVYYSVGFGSTKMKNCWSIVVPGVDEDDDSVIEYILGDDSAGSQLDTSFTTIYDSTEDSMRTVTITRSLSDQDNLSSDYYEFSSDTSKESVIW